jgi:hypothetical protein
MFKSDDSNAASEAFYYKAFWCAYGLLLFATHAPLEDYSGQELWFPKGDAYVDDKLIHASMYVILHISCVLAWGEQMASRWYLDCWEGLGLFVGPAAIVFVLATFDEVTQPFFWRSCSLADLCADVLGIGLGLVISVAFIMPQFSKSNVSEEDTEVDDFDDTEELTVSPALPLKNRSNSNVSCLEAVEVGAADDPTDLQPAILSELSDNHAMLLISQVPTSARLRVVLPTSGSTITLIGTIDLIEPQAIENARLAFTVRIRLESIEDELAA